MKVAGLFVLIILLPLAAGASLRHPARSQKGNDAKLGVVSYDRRTQQAKALPAFHTERVSVGSDGTVAAVDDDGNLFVSYDDANWTLLRGEVVDVAVIDRSSICIVGTDANVYRLNGNNWDQIGIYSAYVAAGADGTIAVVNSDNGSIWVKVEPYNWAMVPYVIGATRVAVVDEYKLYFLSADGAVFRSDRVNPPVQVGHSSVEISASGDGTVTVVNVLNDVWQKVDDSVGDWWFIRPGKAVNVAVLNRDSWYILDEEEHVQHFA